MAINNMTPGLASRQLESKQQAVPNFFIIGAAKAGTTSLWNHLSQHPQIYMHPHKQLNFFASDGIPDYSGAAPNVLSRYTLRTWEDYCEEFADAEDRTAVGEACNAYLYSPTAPARLHSQLPHAKLVAVLRNPAQRAFSRYLQLVRSGREPLREFGAALLAEKQRIAENWWPEFHYLRAGMYHEQLSRYFQLFPREQIRVYLYDDLLADPVALHRDLFGFLDVSQNFVPEMEVRYSVSGVPRSPQFDWVLKKVRTARPVAERILRKRQLDILLSIAGRVHNYNLVKPQIDPATRQWAIEQYREDTLKLQDLIGKDLSGWLN